MGNLGRAGYGGTLDGMVSLESQKLELTRRETRSMLISFALLDLSGHTRESFYRLKYPSCFANVRSIFLATTSASECFVFPRSQRDFDELTFLAVRQRRNLDESNPRRTP